MSSMDENRSPEEREEAKRMNHPRPRGKGKKPRAPRVVKKREYRVFRIHTVKSISEILPSGVDIPGFVAQEMPIKHPNQKSAKDWIDDTAKPDEVYMCACVLFVAKAVQKTAIEIE